jgi:60 kDa SS-A/Ro ribonucleoprotein
MANKMLFASTPGALSPGADTINEAGGTAYALCAKAALAQYAATSCLNQIRTFATNAGMDVPKRHFFSSPRFLADAGETT